MKWQTIEWNGRKSNEMAKGTGYKAYKRANGSRRKAQGVKIDLIIFNFEFLVLNYLLDTTNKRRKA